MTYDSKLAFDRTLDATLAVLVHRFGFTRRGRIGFFRYFLNSRLAPGPIERLGDKLGLFHFAMHEIAHMVVLRQRTDPAPKEWLYRYLKRARKEAGGHGSDGIMGDPLLEIKVRALQVAIVQNLQLNGVPARIKELNIPTRIHTQFTNTGRLKIVSGEYDRGASSAIMNLVMKHDEDVQAWAREIAEIIQLVAAGCSGTEHEYWLERITAPGIKGKRVRRI